jgi:hypothetical protein
MRDDCCEMFAFAGGKQVRLADVDGRAIRLGTVLRHIEDGARGVVVAIKRAGDVGSVLDCVGDIHVQVSPGGIRCTNMYASWRRIPRNEQTYDERLLSWLMRPHKFDGELIMDKSESLAVDGIMALLPDDAVNWERGPFPDSLENALRFLVGHLSKMALCGKMEVADA